MTAENTLNVIAAIHALALRHRNNLADGKGESTLELIGYLAEYRAVRRAIAGIREVPAELADLDDSELPALAEEVSATLALWGVSHRKADITNEVLRDIVDSIPVFKEAVNRWHILLNNFPPSAEPAE